MDENESIGQSVDPRIVRAMMGEETYSNARGRVGGGGPVNVAYPDGQPPPAASEGIGAVTGQPEAPYPFLRGIPGKPSPPGGEKTWAECAPEERQERLRGELQRLAAELRHVRERVGLLLQHQHGEAGALLVPVYGVGMEGCSAAPDGWKPFDPLA